MHIEAVEPKDLSVPFLKEFMALPTKDDDGEYNEKYRRLPVRHIFVMYVN